MIFASVATLARVKVRANSATFSTRFARLIFGAGAASGATTTAATGFAPEEVPRGGGRGSKAPGQRFGAFTAIFTSRIVSRE